MKTGTKIALLVALIMLAIGATLCNIARGRGESIKELADTGAFSMNWGALSFGTDQKGYTVCTEGEVRFSAEKVRTLDLDWVSGSVSVEPYGGKEILVQETSARSLSEKQCMRWRLSGETLSVLYCANNAGNVPSKDLTVLVPRTWAGKDLSADTVSAAVTLRDLAMDGQLDIDTISGTVTVEDCSGKDLDIDTTSGDVRLTRMDVRGTLDVDTVSGKVTAEDCVCEKADVDTTSSDVCLLGLPANCTVSADTVSGDIKLDFAGKPGRIQVDTASGDVTLLVPRGTSLDLDFDSGSGKLSGDYRSGAGGVSVEVDTMSGDLTVKEK